MSGPSRETRRWIARVVCVALVLGVAALQRDTAARRLQVDEDEPLYLRLAFRYRGMIETGNLTRIVEFEENREHPPLGKALYALPLLASSPPEPDWSTLAPRDPIAGPARPALLATRRLSVAAGALQCLAVALVHPIAGLLLADHMYHIKYTSEVYLEAIPGLLAILAALLLERATRARGVDDTNTPRLALLAASAAIMGLAVSCKYVYGLVGLVLVPSLLSARKAGWRGAMAFVVIASLVFLAADPVLWHDSAGRLWRSLTFHWGFASRLEAPLPWWTPIGHLLHIGPETWHIPVPSTGFADRLLVPLALFGLPWAWKRRPIWTAWAVLGLAFLLAWPTKWAQYILVALPPMAVCAAIGLEEAGRLWVSAWKAFRT